MIGRNDPCPCGSGKKYKKCCQSKKMISIEEVQAEELERILQTFYDEYPENEDVSEYAALVEQWGTTLNQYLIGEMIEAIVLDEFFFHNKRDIWTGYLDKQLKKSIRPSVSAVLNSWKAPHVFIGEVIGVEEGYMKVKHALEDETIYLRRESEKPVPVGVHLYCFILPDGTSKANHYLAVSSLIFFPTDFTHVIEAFTEQFKTQNALIAAQYLEEHGFDFWKQLGENGFDGGEFTEFEAGVLIEAMQFLETRDRPTKELVEIMEDYLVELQPNARKEVAIAAGAIRFGQEQNLFEPLNMTIKEIAESFDVSPSSLNKYYKEIMAYYTEKA